MATIIKLEKSCHKKWYRILWQLSGTYSVLFLIDCRGGVPNFVLLITGHIAWIFLSCITFKTLTFTFFFTLDCARRMGQVIAVPIFPLWHAFAVELSLQALAVSLGVMAVMDSDQCRSGRMASWPSEGRTVDGFSGTEIIVASIIIIQNVPKCQSKQMQMQQW